MDASIAAWLAKLPSQHALAEKNLGLKAAKAVANNPAAANGAQAVELASWLQNPIYRCLQREYTSLASMLETVQSDLSALRDVLSGRAKPSNHIRQLLATLRRDVLPKAWFRAGMPRGLAPSPWMEDFARRLNQIGSLVALNPSQYGANTRIWLGGLQAPEGLVAATRQTVAHAHSWPLEQLELRVTVEDKNGASGPVSADSFVFEGMVLHGASWNGAAGALDMSGDDKLSVLLPSVRFTWVRREEGNDVASKVAAGQLVPVPVYLDATRQTFLFQVQLPQPDALQQQSQGKHVWQQRGTCLTTWSSAGNAHE